MTLLALPPGVRPDLDAVAAWLRPIAPVATLAATPQDPELHAEGDAWTHTQLALEALVEGPLYAALAEPARAIVATAVGLHAIGKPTTTHDSIARNHAAKADTLARAALWRAGVPFASREHVCALIRHRQAALGALDGPDPTRIARMLSLVTRHDWLVVTADACARGRRCADPAAQTRLVDHCALWAEHARELAIFDRPQPFASAHARRVWCESPSRQPDVEPHDDTTCEVIVMSGLPASGKDTWLAGLAGLPVVSLDELRLDLDIEPTDAQGEVIAAAREQARVHLRAGAPFAWNATNLTRKLRAQLVELARSYRARVRIVYCEAAAADQDRRNRARRAVVPRQAIGRMLGRWTVPDPSEAHEVTYVVPDAADPVAWPPRY